ncbi:hypothetical protein NMG60_11018165 [Bertholletia excelsa]
MQHLALPFPTCPIHRSLYIFIYINKLYNNQSNHLLISSSTSRDPYMLPSRKKLMKASSMATMADIASFYCAIVLLAFILLGGVKENSAVDEPVRGNQISDRPCDEIYVVGEGETLHTIGDKCGDPFIVEQNPHIHDPDDVFPGLVIKITPSKPRKLSK